MIIDVTGTELTPTPGAFGRDCLGNGEHEGIECCCDECDYYVCCFAYCSLCGEQNCPSRKEPKRSPKTRLLP